MEKEIKILVVSDIHGKKTIADKILKNEDYVYAISCGDHLLDKDYMTSNFDYCVDGNNDIYFDKYCLNKPTLDFTLADYKFHVEHGHMIGDYWSLRTPDVLFDETKNIDCDFLIYGHSHFPIYYKDAKTHRILLNPGSPSLPRWNSKPSYAIITIKNGKKYENVEVIFKEVNEKS